MKPKILVIDDELSMLKWIKIALEDKYEVKTLQDPSKFSEFIKENKVDLILTDIKMPEISGFDVLDIINKFSYDIPCILMTAYVSVDTVISALRKGARDFLIKPFSEEELIFRIEKHLPRIEKKYEFIGEDPKTVEIKKMALKVAQTDVPVFIYGESGVGKEVLARFIHINSKRKKNKFIAINCAAIPKELLESELFGYKKGAFTGAFKDKKGFFESAEGGTLFLDEIVEMPLELQPKLLRVLETMEITPLGSEKSVKVDVRIIAATNKEPKKAISDGKLREDLYYRIAAFPIYIPPLRERKRDIKILVDYILRNLSRKLGKTLKIDKEALDIIMGYSWPGNVRELENILERASILAESDVVKKEHFPLEIVEEGKESTKLRELEERYIVKVLEEEKGNVQKAAEKLGIHPSTLYRKLKRMGIKFKNGK
jgi:DNA-binding NtrC family response regulator